MGTCKSQCCGDKAATHNLDFDVETNNMSALNADFSQNILQDSKNFKNDLSNISQIEVNKEQSVHSNDKEENLIFTEEEQELEEEENIQHLLSGIEN